MAFSPQAVRVDLGRAGIVGMAVTIAVFGLLTAGAVYAAVDTTDKEVMVMYVGYGFAVIFGAFVLLALLALPNAVRSRGLVFDEDGIHHWQGGSWELLPWEEVRAVGIGYEQPPDVPSVPLSIEDAVKDYVLDKASTAMKLDGKRRLGLEIFPARVEVFAEYPVLAMYRKQLVHTPDPELPTERWRIPLPPGVADEVERGAEAHAGKAWLGYFARPWRRGLPV